MTRDPVILNLLTLYVIILAMNTALCGALWYRYRTDLHLALALVWPATAMSFMVQGALSEGVLPVVLGFVSVLAPNLALANLIAISFDVPLKPRPFLMVALLACLSAFGLSQLELAFTWVALPVAIAVSLPLGVTALTVIRQRWSELGLIGKALVASCLAFCAHNLDFAVLRDIPEAAVFGFTIAIFIISALSITAPAVVLELLATRHARADAELAVARRIQANLLPTSRRLGDLELASYMRPTDSVGGDYFDAYESDGVQWLLLGDVTGHGLGAGLVMLMAQSTISAVLVARPDIQPAELNHIANRVLFQNLSRLQEPRHMTAVAIRRDIDDGSITISGSHDNVLVYRAATETVQSIAVGHFPVGLGFVDHADATSFSQDSVPLSPHDVLLVTTDGVTEAARDGDYTRGVFGEQRLAELLAASHEAPVESIKEQLLDALHEYTGGVYHDDVAFLIAKVTA